MCVEFLDNILIEKEGVLSLTRQNLKTVLKAC